MCGPIYLLPPQLEEKAQDEMQEETQEETQEWGLAFPSICIRCDSSRGFDRVYPETRLIPVLSVCQQYQSDEVSAHSPGIMLR